MTTTGKPPSKAAALRAALAWLADNAQRLELGRQVSALERAQKLNLAICTEALGEQDRLVIGRHDGHDVVIAKVDGRASVSWKDVVVELKGPAYAAQLAAAADAHKPQVVKIVLE